MRVDKDQFDASPGRLLKQKLEKTRAMNVITRAQSPRADNP
jgi:hypothetical protein